MNSSLEYNIYWIPHVKPLIKINHYLFIRIVTFLIVKWCLFNSLQFNFVGRILGPRGMTAKQLEQETGCKIMVRGKGSMRDKKKVSLMKILTKKLIWIRITLEWSASKWVNHSFICVHICFNRNGVHDHQKLCHCFAWKRRAKH